MPADHLEHDPIDTAGKTVKVGQTVSFVHAGEHHVAQVSKIVRDGLTHLPHVLCEIVVSVPVGAVRITEHTADSINRAALDPEHREQLQTPAPPPQGVPSGPAGLSSNDPARPAAPSPRTSKTPPKGGK